MQSSYHVGMSGAVQPDTSTNGCSCMHAPIWVISPMQLCTHGHDQWTGQYWPILTLVSSRIIGVHGWSSSDPSSGPDQRIALKPTHYARPSIATSVSELQSGMKPAGSPCMYCTASADKNGMTCHVVLLAEAPSTSNAASRPAASSPRCCECTLAAQHPSNNCGPQDPATSVFSQMFFSSEPRARAK